MAVVRPIRKQLMQVVATTYHEWGPREKKLLARIDILAPYYHDYDGELAVISDISTAQTSLDLRWYIGDVAMSIMEKQADMLNINIISWYELSEIGLWKVDFSCGYDSPWFTSLPRSESKEIESACLACQHSPFPIE